MGRPIDMLRPESVALAALDLLKEALDGWNERLFSPLNRLFSPLGDWVVERHDPRDFTPAESKALVAALWALYLQDEREWARNSHVELARVHWRRLHERICAFCGCSDSFACDRGCHWVDEDRCSTCAPITDLTRRMMS